MLTAQSLKSLVSLEFDLNGTAPSELVGAELKWYHQYQHYTFTGVVGANGPIVKSALRQGYGQIEIKRSEMTSSEAQKAEQWLRDNPYREKVSVIKTKEALISAGGKASLPVGHPFPLPCSTYDHPIGSDWLVVSGDQSIVEGVQHRPTGVWFGVDVLDPELVLKMQNILCTHREEQERGHREYEEYEKSRRDARLLQFQNAGIDPASVKDIFHHCVGVDGPEREWTLKDELEYQAQMDHMARTQYI